MGDLGIGQHSAARPCQADFARNPFPPFEGSGGDAEAIGDLFAGCAEEAEFENCCGGVIWPFRRPAGFMSERSIFSEALGSGAGDWLTVSSAGFWEESIGRRRDRHSIGPDLDIGGKGHGRRF
jgi:hypothetical protein